LETLLLKQLEKLQNSNYSCPWWHHFSSNNQKGKKRKHLTFRGSYMIWCSKTLLCDPQTLRFLRI
jgi:hypothetical protein